MGAILLGTRVPTRCHKLAQVASVSGDTGSCLQAGRGKWRLEASSTLRHSSAPCANDPAAACPFEPFEASSFSFSPRPICQDKTIHFPFFSIESTRALKRLGSLTRFCIQLHCELLVMQLKAGMSQCARSESKMITQ